MTRYLIVNADDFGATAGVTRGIMEGFQRGIVTSTSLMVTTPACEDAAVLASQTSGLSVGLHVDLQEASTRAGVDPARADRVYDELRRQLELFETMTGQRPTHLDSHHDHHRDPRLLGAFLRLAREEGLPLRGHSPAHHVAAFYGQWRGETHAEQIGVESLLRLVDADRDRPIVELSCHPGHVDDALRSSYGVEREIELQTLCDPAARDGLLARGIALIGFRDLTVVEPLAVGGRA